VVAAAYQRADGRCELCGLNLGDERGVDHSLHHRRPRGMGGTSDPATSSVSNVLVICGSGTTGFHGRVEQYRSIAMQAGWLLRQHQDPASTPVQVLIGCRRARVLLAADGTYGEVPA
jgi:5-methylcytosine-specific restriction enzyme A